MSKSPSPSAPNSLRSRRVARRYRRADLRLGSRRALLSSPAYLVAILLHAVVLLVLSVWTIAVYVREHHVEIRAKLAATSEVELTDPQAQRDALDALVTDLECELDLSTEADTDDPFQEALGSSAGSQVANGVAVLGVGGAPAGFGRGGSQGRRGGPSSASLGAVRTGLDWLSRHRAGDGGWGALPSGHGQSKRLPTRGDAARTGLAVICYLAGGHSQAEDGPYRQTLIEARDWLIHNMKHGRVRSRRDQAYSQAIATLALGELLQREDTPELRRATKLAVKCIVAWQSSLGWRYKPRDDTDTSITSWMVLALKSAAAAGVSVPDSCFVKVRSYLKQVSLQGGNTRYTLKGRIDPAMNATGLFLRILLGNDRRSRRNNLAARLVVGEAKQALPKPDVATPHLYQLYYAALSMFLYGGEQWRELNPLLRDAVVGAQVADGSCESGSWLGTGSVYDPVLNTCFATLILETYFRYLSSDGDHLRLDADLLEELAGLSLESQLIQGSLALSRARQSQNRGALLAAEASYREALAGVESEPGRDEQLLAAEVRARLVEISVLGGDHEQARQLAEDYLSSLPDGVQPEGGIVHFLRLARYQQTIELVEPAFKQEAQEELRHEADGELLRLSEELAEERELCEGAELAELERMQAEVGRLRQTLSFAIDPGAAIAGGLVDYRNRPAEGAVEPAEWRLVRGLLQRSLRQYEGAARGGAQLYQRAEDDLAWARGRRLVTRLRDPARKRRLARLLEQNLALRIRAQLELGHHDAVLKGVPEFVRAFPASSFKEPLESYERAALIGLVQTGQATAEQRDHLARTLLRWAGEGDGPAGLEALAVGELLREWGAHDEARAPFGRAPQTPDLAEADQVQARLGLLAIALDEGNTAEGQRQLAAMPEESTRRLDVRRARCQLLRRSGEAEPALEHYLKILRALGDERPVEFWEVAEQTAQTYLELRLREQAKDFLEGLRRMDPDLGGEGDLKDRIVDLMRQLDGS